ncbi:cation transporter [Planosporangium sp. 12N6]|uniref:cation transporter n=1 Tax=Planosporangium spinosum TaxID=3402278 RepID=UPI003CED8CA8
MQERSRRAAHPDPAGAVVVPLPTGLCRRCVRTVSRRVRDVPGVVSLEVDAVRGLLRVCGDADARVVVAALEAGGFGGCRAADDDG